MHDTHDTHDTRHHDRWLTAGFEPISLDALNAKAAMLERLDNKYVLRAPVLEAAAPRLAALFDVLEIDGRRSFTYETCYFDDPQRRSYFDHHQGRRRRMKVRVRRYVDAGLCFLEVKLKDKRGVTVKRRLPLPPCSLRSLPPEGAGPTRERPSVGPVDASQSVALDAASRAFVAAAWRDMYGRDMDGHEKDRPLEPVLQMTYRRMTLVAREGGERMTIDTGIHFLCAWGAREARRTDDEVFIVETKSAQGRGIADAVLREQHQHPVNSCSKYCVGMGLTGAVRRFNRFRPAMRLLGAWPRAWGHEWRAEVER